MGDPKYSIVVPTRNRADTLRHCLEACLNADHDSFEIVVADNFSADETSEVVKRFSSPRIKYLRSERPLSMAKNWERALAATTGEWVTFIGDDDGILPYTFQQLDRIIEQTSPRLIGSHSAYYVWPNANWPGRSDYLKIPLSKKTSIANGRKVLTDFLAFRSAAYCVPGMYHGFVHRSLIDEVRKRTGDVFVNYIPDVYTTFVLTFLAGSYVQCEFPLTIVGHSAKSNGGASLQPHAVRRAAQVVEFEELCQKDGLVTHPWVPAKWVCWNTAVSILDSFLVAQDRFFANDKELAVDRKKVVRSIVGHWSVSDDDWPELRAAIRDSLADEPGLSAWFDNYAQPHDRLVESRRQMNGGGSSTSAEPTFPKGQGAMDGCLHLDGGDFGVSEIAGAARVCEKIVGLRAHPVDYASPRHGRLDRLGVPKPVKRILRGLLVAIGRRECA